VGFVASAATRTTPYLPFMDVPEGAPFRWRLGVRPLDLDEWIELGPGADEAIEAKSALNRDHGDTVFAALDDRPDVVDAAQEVADALVDHLRRRWPDRYGAARLEPSLHPLDAAARLVPEDLVLMVPEPDLGGRLVFAAGSVCFPNRWDLRSKVGLPLEVVHAPVARLNEQLATPIERFFERLTPARSFWRLGWGVLDTADWYTPLDGSGAPRPFDPSPAAHFLRVERETLRRFPRTGCVLFTIRTYVTAIPDVADDPRAAERLAGALAALPDDVRTYKGVVRAAAGVIELLRRSATSNDVDSL
jgi:hypothetical protein